MVTELIPVLIAKEQDIDLIYNNIRYTFQLRYDDYNENWYILNIINTIDGSTVVSGLRILLSVDVFSGLSYLGFSNMSLIDTDPMNETAIDMFNDFGDRLKLYRQV